MAEVYPYLTMTKIPTNPGGSVHVGMGTNGDKVTNVPTKTFLQKVNAFARSKTFTKGIFVSGMVLLVASMFLFSLAAGLLFLSGVCLALYLTHLLSKRQSNVQI